MLEALKRLFTPPTPAGPPVSLTTYSTDQPTISSDGVTIEDSGWRIECDGRRTVRLFEFVVPQPGVERCILTYRAEMRTSEARGKTYLEMWCRFPGRGEFFSRGLHHAVQGTTGWASYETPFFLKKGQAPDLLKLNLVVEGPGTVWIKDVEVLKTPLR